jgi:SAM-dependent methyltransferase
MLPDVIKKLPGVDSALLTATWVQRRYFDWRHGVETMGDMELAEMDAVTPDLTLTNPYHPCHPRAARRILGSIPIEDHSRYTFIDLGSGKGLMLLLAAEYPYAAVRGVEFSRKLNEIASANIRRYRNPRQQCFDVASVNVDAREYEFPQTPLVVYVFNSFRHQLLAQVVRRLETSLAAAPRDVVVVYMYPLDHYVFDQSPQLTLIPSPFLTNTRVYRSIGVPRSGFDA